MDLADYQDAAARTLKSNLPPREALAMAAIGLGGARKGRSLRGDRNPQAKLTAEQVRGVFKRRAEGATQSAIARDLCVDKSCISRILGGKAWASLEAVPCSP